MPDVAPALTPPRCARLLGLGLAALLLAGCGAGNGSQELSPTGSGPSPGASPGSTAAASATPGPATPPAEDLVAGPSKTPSAAAPVTVTGTLAPGVEGGCLLLRAGGTTYVLVGRTAGLVAGRAVTVTGTVDRDLLTTCQQGTPLRVQRVTGG